MLRALCRTMLAADVCLFVCLCVQYFLKENLYEWNDQLSSKCAVFLISGRLDAVLVQSLMNVIFHSKNKYSVNNVRV